MPRGLSRAPGMIDRMTGKVKDRGPPISIVSIALNAKDSTAFSWRRGPSPTCRFKPDRQRPSWISIRRIVLNQGKRSGRAGPRRGARSVAEGQQRRRAGRHQECTGPKSETISFAQTRPRGWAMLVVRHQYDPARSWALNQLVGKSRRLRNLRPPASARVPILGRRRTADSAMADLDAVLGKQPKKFGRPCCLRGMVWSSKRDYAKALDDLSGAIAPARRSVEGYFARGQGL